MKALDVDQIRRLLCLLGDHVRDTIVAGRAAVASGSAVAFSDVTGRAAADTIYEVDRISDDALLEWFDAHWPPDEPVRLVTEALDAPVVLPTGADAGAVRWTCIVDPVDGTRGLMYDKRAAWVLAAAAPCAAGDAPRLRDLVVAAMTEIPVVKQWASDQISGVRGCGRRGLVAERVDVRTGARAPLPIRPSEATALEHGWASFARFLPQGKALLSRFEERLWEELYDHGRRSDVAIFDDQYLATGGQFHELLAGHDRLLGDLRPLAFMELDMPMAMACHPYDCCTGLLLVEAGCVLTDPWGAPLDAPLDTVTPVAWVGYANAELAALVQPVVDRLLAECFPATPRPR